MLSSVVLAVLAVTVIATSFLSGIFGMAGGTILLGVLLVFLDVAPTMVLFGATQAAANGWRVVLWRRYVQWGIVGRYVIGATLAFLVVRPIAFLPDKMLVYFFVGTLPFMVYALPTRWLALDIARPGAPYLCGALIMLIQLFGGASGHILDLFFRPARSTASQSSLPRGSPRWSRICSGSPISHRSLRLLRSSSRGGSMSRQSFWRLPGRHWPRACWSA